VTAKRRVCCSASYPLSPIKSGFAVALTASQPLFADQKKNFKLEEEGKLALLLLLPVLFAETADFGSASGLR
jgi:hypothetical protein